MAWKKCLTAFLIFLLLFSFVPMVNAEGPDKPLEEHPWEEVKSVTPPKFESPELVTNAIETYFFSVSPFCSGIFMLVVEKKCQGEVRKEQSAITVSLPRKK